MGIFAWLAGTAPRARQAPTLRREREVQREFTTKIQGVSFDNPDGSSRQRAIRKLKVGDVLVLEPEYDNPVDPNAIKIIAPRLRTQIGYIGVGIARRLGEQMAEGGGADAVVEEIMPGTTQAAWGVAIRVRIY